MVERGEHLVRLVGGTFKKDVVLVLEEPKFVRFELVNPEQNYRVSVDKFYWISFRTAEIVERAAARHCRPVGTLGSLGGQLGDGL